VNRVTRISNAQHNQLPDATYRGEKLCPITE
jgi:hypothetical protein